MARTFIDNVSVQWTDTEMESSNNVSMDIDKTQTLSIDEGDRHFFTHTVGGGARTMFPPGATGNIEFRGIIIYDSNEPLGTRQCTALVDGVAQIFGHGFNFIATTSFTITTTATLGCKIHWGWFIES